MLPAPAGDLPPGTITGHGATPSWPGFTESYTCLVSTATPDGALPYRYVRVLLDFPLEARHPSAATHRYRYQALAPDGSVLRVANCTIPRTDRAIGMMNRHLNVPRQIPPGGTSLSVEPGVQVCDPQCLLPPIIVIGDPEECDPWMSLNWCGGGGGTCTTSTYPGNPNELSVLGCWTGGGGGGGGGGYDPDPGDPYSWDDGTGRPSCIRDASGFCVTRMVREDEWSRLGERIEQIREHPAECKGAKDALRGLYAQGRQSQRLRFWDGYDKTAPNKQRFGQNLADGQGRYIEYDSYWVWNHETVLVHEGLHLYLHLINSPLLGQDNEAWVESMSQTCS